MTLSKGWINRQITRVERDVKHWPDWMRREAALRAEEQKAPRTSSKTVQEDETVAPLSKRPEGRSG